MESRLGREMPSITRTRMPMKTLTPPIRISETPVMSVKKHTDAWGLPASKKRVQFQNSNGCGSPYPKAIICLIWWTRATSLRSSRICHNGWLAAFAFYGLWESFLFLQAKFSSRCFLFLVPFSFLICTLQYSWLWSSLFSRWLKPLSRRWGGLVLGLKRFLTTIDPWSLMTSAIKREEDKRRSSIHEKSSWSDDF